MARSERHAKAGAEVLSFSETLARADFSWRSERAIHHADGTVTKQPVRCRIDTAIAAHDVRHGGVLRQLLGS